MPKRKLLSKNNARNSTQKRQQKREERKAQTKRATEARLAKKTAPQPNPNAEMPPQDEAGASTSAARTEEAMEPPPPTPGPVPTPDMEEEILEFGDSLPSTSATPIGDLVPLSTTQIAPMDIGEVTPPPMAIDERSQRIEQLEKQLKDRDDTIKFLREQVRNLEALITDLRRQLEQCAETPTATPTTSKTTPNRGRPRKAIDELQRSSRKRLVWVDQKVQFGVLVVTLKRRICAPLRYEQIETNGGVGFVCADVRSALESRFCAAKDNLINFGNNMSPNDLDGLERSIDDFKVFLAEQDRMSAFLSKKPKAHLLLFHFVPFARQHQFIGLLDEQGDETLHSVWRRLEQWWKCMPDAEQILQQLEHHFVNNWLLDTGRIDELKRNYEERKGADDTDEEAAEEIDDKCQIDVI
ncbi:hypothetical protein niasHT_022234 [Heterodera trifolii]|uniref:Uncharacterized protein n=1 Tax=Heterodera trifolii TaxID=157864 RepID=A0ABD2KQ30_9BILA